MLSCTLVDDLCHCIIRDEHRAFGLHGLMYFLLKHCLQTDRSGLTFCFLWMPSNSIFGYSTAFQWAEGKVTEINIFCFIRNFYHSDGLLCVTLIQIFIMLAPYIFFIWHLHFLVPVYPVILIVKSLTKGAYCIETSWSCSLGLETSQDHINTALDWVFLS